LAPLPLEGTEFSLSDMRAARGLANPELVPLQLGAASSDALGPDDDAVVVAVAGLVLLERVLPLLLLCLAEDCRPLRLHKKKEV